jgi:[acyl-carrier-protein] S-malonyltransferase
MKLGLVFPGQGSQRVGMGAALAAAFPAARRTFDEASAALGYDVLALCAGGPEEQLVRTEYTQPAILTVSVAAYRVYAERGPAPAAAAGHSLGEYSALVAAGMLAFGDAVRLVRTRGRAMQLAVPEGRGKMAAILGLEAAALDAACREAAQGEVVAPANYNAPGQIVISGAAAAVERAIQIARAKGAKRALPLDVSAPFHCALMEPAARELERALEGMAFAAPLFPVIANVDGRPYAGDAADARRRLVDQVCAPVRWEACVRGLGDVTHTLECGAGKVVSTLVKRIAPELTLWNLESPDDLAALAY